MKHSNLILAICAIALFASSCQKDTLPQQEVSVSFNIGMPQTKALGDGAAATLLSVRVFDASGAYLFEQTAVRDAAGWDVDLKLVPGTYSFSFWASGQDADACLFENEYMTLNYPRMDMNSDAEDAFWTSLKDCEVTSSFTRSITLKRPFALLQLVTDDFIDEPLEGATSAFTITGAIPTRMNLITGEMDQMARKAIFAPASISDYTAGRRTIAAYAYVLAPKEGLSATEVSYSITLSDGRNIEGSAADVPLTMNHRTTLSDN